MATAIRYYVDLGDRIHHLVRITLTVPADLAPGARIVLPVWTPGSYVVRDYVRHVQWVRARTADGTEVAVGDDGLTAWRLPTDLAGPVELTLELYANDLTVRTNHVDDHHALLIPAATFPYVEGGEDRPHLVHLPPVPAEHQVFSLLPHVADEPDTYRAEHRDHLIDAAFEVGDLPHVEVQVAGVPHTIVWAGHGGDPDLDALARDTAAIVRSCAALVDGRLPVERYTMLIVGWDTGGGGLEHRDGAVLQLPVRAFQDDDLLARAHSLIAHEYLHLWNVKRLVPADLVRPDYEHPTRSPSLWVAEGWTAYYDDLLPVRAEVAGLQRLLDTLAETRRRIDDTPGADLQALRQAGMDAWTKHYVRDENARNAMTDYYAHGSLVAFELDLRLRAAAPDGDGLDEVLRLLWSRHADTEAGYTEQDVLDAVATVGGDELAALVDARVGVAGRPELDEVVAAVGLEWVESEGLRLPHLGVSTEEDDQGVRLASVRRGGAAWRAGLTGGDRLLAIDGTTLRRGDLRRALRAVTPGDEVAVTVRRGPRLLTRTVTLDPPAPHPELRVDPSAGEAARRAFARWTARPWPGQHGPADG